MNVSLILTVLLLTGLAGSGAVVPAEVDKEATAGAAAADRQPPPATQSPPAASASGAEEKKAAPARGDSGGSTTGSATGKGKSKARTTGDGKTSPATPAPGTEGAAKKSTKSGKSGKSGKPASASSEKEKATAKDGSNGSKSPSSAKKDGDSQPEKQKAGSAEGPKEARTATLPAEKLEGFSRQPAEVQTLLRYALELTSRGLTYRVASADPELGGTDCSGFVYHVLQKHGYRAVPRQSDQMYEWAWQAGTFRACNGLSMNTFEFKDLRPGDLLFWVNTTRDGPTDRDPPVTHVMIYLGRREADKHPVCAGSSDGRTYEGQRMCGVSVFDFRLPAPDSGARFIGYAHLPPKE